MTRPVIATIPPGVFHGLNPEQYIDFRIAISDHALVLMPRTLWTLWAEMMKEDTEEGGWCEHHPATNFHYTVFTGNLRVLTWVIGCVIQTEAWDEEGWWRDLATHYDECVMEALFTQPQRPQ